ncbi:DUF6287 domain-containing protein [Companilactobacillus ginsenosidimutans]|uniref:DUF6287 domain-containing protein n=1 Tax=Companilactobacillus ginsenosidimutans TaxID=1007676 RepID=A0A0H4QGD9_9LACO|nr:DUF6287 domain-containing protein [Companilactobacillus ginsenosidimutans]AKP67469.1 hypothetical protein ABM34_07960 [Companilactobacillus ginsenosidimutans]
MLSKFENESLKYMKSKNPNKQVQSTYRDSIKSIKKSIKEKNNSRIEAAILTNQSEETEKNLQKKNSSLKTLKKELVSQEKIVYSKAQFKKINDKVDKQISENNTLIDKYSKVNNKQNKDDNISQVTTNKGKKDETVSKTSSKMNLQQIKSGDFSSLVGSWKEIAEGANFYRGNGFEWKNDVSGMKLSISKSQISDGQVVLRMGSNGKLIMNENGPEGEVDSRQTDVLTLDAEVGAHAYDIVFIPKGISYEPDLDGKINLNKEHIYIRTSNNDFVDVFERV